MHANDVTLEMQMQMQMETCKGTQSCKGQTQNSMCLNVPVIDYTGVDIARVVLSRNCGKALVVATQMVVFIHSRSNRELEHPLDIISNEH